MHTVVTSFSPSGYMIYAHKCISSFNEHWPKKVNLLCAWEGEEPPIPNLNGFNLLETSPAKEFIERHKDNLVVQGREEHPSRRWGRKDRIQGYSFRHNAYKFARKVFAVEAAARYVERGKLFWIDSDVITHTPITRTFLNKLLPDEADLCYLAREKGYHSELGFVGYNLNRPETKAFISDYMNLYASDEFLNLREWDDCHVFDHLVSERKPRVCPIVNSSQPHPFDRSPLARYMLHNKGRRKHPPT